MKLLFSSILLVVSCVAGWDRVAYADYLTAEVEDRNTGVVYQIDLDPIRRNEYISSVGWRHVNFSYLLKEIISGTRQ